MSLTIEVAETPEVAGPKSVPTNGRFETSSDNYSDGFPDVPEPEWMVREAERFARSRAAS